MPEYDFGKLKAYAKEVEASYGERNRINDEMTYLYWMEWKDAVNFGNAAGDTAKVTRSPRPANAIEGMVRLLCASDPIFSVPGEVNPPFNQASAEKLEKFSTAMWKASGKIADKPHHFDAVLSGVLYDEIHIDIQSTRDLALAAQGTPNEARAAEVAQRTPFLFKPTHPSMGFPVWDSLGLCFTYNKRVVKAYDVINEWGKKGEEAIDRIGKATSLYQPVTINDVYDLAHRCVWLDGVDFPILDEMHGLPFIPKAVTKVQGSNLFDKPDEQRRPVLYNLWKSGIADRQSLFLSVMYTLVYAIGSSPMFVNYLLNPAKPPEVDYSVPGGQINMRVGERREPMAKNAIDPSLMQSWQISQELEMESTIYRQTLGEPLGANAPYSMVALLSQSGRLPLLLPQRQTGGVIGKAVEIALKIARREGNRSAVNSSGIYAILEPSDIPEFFELETKLDIAMPQDMLNNVNAAIMGTQGENPLFTVEWAQEKLLQIGQPEEMKKAVWREQSMSLHHKTNMTRMMAEMAQQQQMLNNPGTNAGGMPGSMRPPGPGGPQMPGQMGTPELAGQEKPFPNMPSPFEPAQPMIPPDQGVPPEMMP